MEISLRALPDFAAGFVRSLPTETGAAAYIIGLSGELGAGKTTFVQHVAKELGVTVPVTSPTFVIAQRYTLSRTPFRSLVHVDAYRLSPGERGTFGWDEYVADPGNLVFIEWPERLPGGLPPDARHLVLAVAGPDTRRITDHA